MNGKPIVSVVIIFLNAEKFIDEAITSAISQTYERWELLLVDDGSSDSSTEIALRYAERYPGRIHYLEHDGHQNRGMSASRNLGISNANGEYVAFLDADDVWWPHKLEQQVGILESQPEAALVCGRSQWWYSWTQDPADMQRDFVQGLNVQLDSVVKPPTLLILFLQNEWATLHDMLVRLDVVKSVGGYEESFRGMYEDQVFHSKLCLKAPVFVSGECWCRYRQHLHACTSVSHKVGQAYCARQTFLNWLEQYLSNQGLKDTEVWKVVQKELWRYRRLHPLLFRLSGRVQRFVRQMEALLSGME